MVQNVDRQKFKNKTKNIATQEKIQGFFDHHYQRKRKLRSLFLITEEKSDIIHVKCQELMNERTGGEK